MDPKHASSGPEVQALRNQLQEKERHIEQLEVSTRFRVLFVDAGFGGIMYRVRQHKVY